MTRCQTSASASQNFSDVVWGEASTWLGPMPALLTRICKPPRRFDVRRHGALAIVFSLVMSQVTALGPPAGVKR